MADFYPLLSRAVSGLPEQTLENRQAIYDRARNALLGQLRAADPAPDQSVIDAELAALDQAIQRVESELPAAAPQPAAVPPPSVPPPAAPPPAPRAPGIIIKPPPPRAPPPPAPVASPPPAPPAPVAAPVQPSPVAPSSPPAQPDPAAAAPVAAPVSAPAPGANYVPVAQQPATAASGPGETPAAPPLPAEDGRPRVSDAPAPKRRKMGGALALLSLLFVVAAAGAGYFSWKMRLLPERFLSGNPVVATPGTPPANSEKTAGATEKPSDGKTAAGAKTESDAPAAKTAGRAGSNEPAKPEPVKKTQSASAGSGSSGNSSAPQGIAVAQRAALLIQPLKSEANGKVQNFNGNVIWTTRNISRGAGQPLSFSVRADIIIPDAKFKATMTLEKNNDTTLPASHMITWRFQREKEGAIKGITEIGVLQMHDDNSRVADPLAGAQAKITPDIYIYALAAPEALRTTNMETLAKRNWFILPVKLSDGREARITMEKGNPGTRVIAEAFKKWGVKLDDSNQ